MTTDMQQDASDMTEAGTAEVDAAESLEQQSAEILAKARYEAFGLVTEARKEAESIIDEARDTAADIVREAEMTAESIRDAARINANEHRAASAAEIDPAKAAAVQELEAEHAELTDRVGSLRTMADQLEARFAALADNAELPPPASTNGSSEGSNAPVLDYSPSVPHPVKAEDEHQDEAEPQEREEKGSFYSRRSAKLPRIGEAGGKSALDMMRSIRESIDGEA